MRANKLAAATTLVLVLALSGAAVPTTAAMSQEVERPLLEARGKRISSQYIVVLKDDQDPRAAAALVNVVPQHVYDAAIRGFAASLTLQQVSMLRRSRAVEFIEEDAEITLDATQSLPNGEPWGLDRIDERQLPLTWTYTYNSSGAGVSAYIIDTGIQTNHPEFGGRASTAFDAFGGNGQDCNGHGTHVAGTVGGTTYGVAKNAQLRGVRVLSCSGSGSTSGVIAGVNWVRNNHVKPAVANMSLGGGLSQAMNTAATNLANAGVFLAVAAGNSNSNACNTSPASASGVFTTAASDRNDVKASFSSHGSCVEGYAPGVAIRSAWIGGGTRTISGTSMATPHVAGVAALYKSRYGDASSGTIVNWIITNSTTGVIRNNPSGTPNRLLYKSTL